MVRSTNGSGTNKERLEEGGVLSPAATLTSRESDAIEELTDAEVKQLIKIRSKVGDYSHHREGGCAWIL
jgi:hypothetical protein